MESQESPGATGENPLVARALAVLRVSRRPGAVGGPPGGGSRGGTYALTGHSAKQFSAVGKKDLAYACIYAYLRFLVWSKLGELEFGEGGRGKRVLRDGVTIQLGASSRHRFAPRAHRDRFRSWPWHFGAYPGTQPRLSHWIPRGSCSSRRTRRLTYRRRESGWSTVMVIEPRKTAEGKGPAAVRCSRLIGPRSHKSCFLR